MQESASVLEIVLTLGMLAVVIGAVIGLTLWGRARKRRGDEASTTNAEGAETMLGNWFS